MRIIRSVLKFFVVSQYLSFYNLIVKLAMESIKCKTGTHLERASGLSLDASFMELAKTETLWGLLVNAGYLTVTHVDYKLKSLFQESREM